MEELFHTGKELGRKAHARIMEQGKRWHSRHIPQWIRDYMLVPYYVANVNGVDQLFIIQYPLTPEEKVHFVPFIKQGFHEQVLST